VHPVVGKDLALLDAVAKLGHRVGGLHGVVEVVEKKRHAEPAGLGAGPGAIDLGHEAEKGFVKLGKELEMLAAGPGGQV
jgi:hypothetical protein